MLREVAGAAAALLAVGCTSEPTAPDVMPAPDTVAPPDTAAPAPTLKAGKMVTYDEMDFRISYPKDWTTVEENSDPQSCPTTVCFQAPGDSHGTPIVMTMAPANLAGGSDLDSVLEAEQDARPVLMGRPRDVGE